MLDRQKISASLQSPNVQLTFIRQANHIHIIFYYKNKNVHISVCKFIYLIFYICYWYDLIRLCVRQVAFWVQTVLHDSSVIFTFYSSISDRCSIWSDQR